MLIRHFERKIGKKSIIEMRSLGNDILDIFPMHHDMPVSQQRNIIHFLLSISKMHSIEQLSEVIRVSISPMESKPNKCHIHVG